MLDAVLTGLVEFVLGAVMARTGRAVLALVTGGRWRGARGDEGLIHGPGGALSFERDGQRVLTTLGLQVLGTLFYVLVVAGVLVTR